MRITLTKQQYAFTGKKTNESDEDPSNTSTSTQPHYLDSNPRSNINQSKPTRLSNPNCVYLPNLNLIRPIPKIDQNNLHLEQIPTPKIDQDGLPLEQIPTQKIDQDDLPLEQIQQVDQDDLPLNQIPQAEQDNNDALNALTRSGHTYDIQTKTTTQSNYSHLEGFIDLELEKRVRDDFEPNNANVFFSQKRHSPEEAAHSVSQFVTRKFTTQQNQEIINQFYLNYGINKDDFIKCIKDAKSNFSNKWESEPETIRKITNLIQNTVEEDQFNNITEENIRNIITDKRQATTIEKGCSSITANLKNFFNSLANSPNIPQNCEIYFSPKQNGISIVNTKSNELYGIKPLSINENSEQFWQLSTFIDHPNISEDSIEIDTNIFYSNNKTNPSKYSILANISYFNTEMPDQIYTEAKSVLNAKSDFEFLKSKQKNKQSNQLLLSAETKYEQELNKFNQTVRQLLSNDDQEIFSDPEKCLENKKNVDNLLKSLQKIDTEELKNLITNKDNLLEIPGSFKIDMLTILKTKTPDENTNKFISEELTNIFKKEYENLKKRFIPTKNVSDNQRSSVTNKVFKYIPTITDSLDQLKKTFNLKEIKNLFKLITNKSDLEKKLSEINEFRKKFNLEIKTTSTTNRRSLRL